jgi:hypothetical protein
MTTEVDNYLEHYGVKGMRWGKRSASDDSSSSSGSRPSRQELRELNKKAKIDNKVEKKAAKEKFNKEWDDEVLGARDRLGKEGENLSAARKQYKADKKVIGRAAAKKVFKEHENKFIETYNIASLETTKESQQRMVATVGLLALSAIAGGVAEAHRQSF